MTTTTKFGVSLINSAPKKCHFRYDIVWVKSASAGFLSSSRMPLRKHEMIYVFYEKLPFYDLSSHQHKFIKEDKGTINSKIYDIPNKDKGGMYRSPAGQYDPPLPNSIVKEPEPEPEVVKEPELCKYDVNKNTYGGGKEGRIKIPKDKKYHEVKYDPPLPTSVVKEEIKYDQECNSELYGNVKRDDRKNKIVYDPPLPNSVVKETQEGIYGTLPKTGAGTDAHSAQYDPPLPTSMLEVKSTRGKHSTEKPVALMSWILKYYSKEGDVILDPTMGSGSTGVACKNMNRNFIGIEKDAEIYEGAVNRIEE